MGKRSLLPAVFLLLVCAGAARAQQEEKPKLTLAIGVAKEMRVQKDGKWTVERVPAETTKRGDVLVYTVTYTNAGKTPARDASIVDPVPAGTVYVLESAEGKRTEQRFSIDGAKTFQPYPATYVVTRKDGKREEKIATAGMYTHIQWIIPRQVAPGESGTVSFKVTVK